MESGLAPLVYTLSLGAVLVYDFRVPLHVQG